MKKTMTMTSCHSKKTELKEGTIGWLCKWASEHPDVRVDLRWWRKAPNNNDYYLDEETGQWIKRD